MIVKLYMCLAEEISPKEIVDLNIMGFETELKDGIFTAVYNKPKCLMWRID